MTENLGNLEDVDDKIIYQGDEYTSEQIRELRKMKFPRKPIEVPEAKQLKGNFRVVSINLENKFLNIKDGDDVEKVFYREDLITEIQGFKKQFKSAIDNEGKTFYIEAGYTTKSGKRSPLILNTMTPIDNFLDAQVKINSGDPDLISEGQAQLEKYYADCLSVKEQFPKTN